MCRCDAHLRLPSGQVQPEIHVNKEEVGIVGPNLLFPIRTRKLRIQLFHPTPLLPCRGIRTWEPVVQPTVA